MILLKYQEITPTKARVVLEHYQPSLLSEEDKVGGAMVESLPQITVPIGKFAELYINPSTQELWYELADRPLTDQERIQQLEDMVANLLLVTNGGAV